MDQGGWVRQPTRHKEAVAAYREKYGIRVG